MKIAFDHDACSAGHVPGGPGGRPGEEFKGFPSAPDWVDLRSRLFAAYEVRIVLAGESGPVRLRTRGSFAGDAASLLNTYGTGSRTVNLDISTNGKPEGGKVASVAGADQTGERG